MDLDFLGKGWNFPFRYDQASGSVLFSSGLENIRQNILVILGTRQGERQMLPKFGCRIHDLLFAPNNQSTISTAATYVREAIHSWEPRVEVQEVEASFASTGSIQISISYRVRATSAVEHLEHLVH
jgi:phage baseplate assembly protein W